MEIARALILAGGTPREQPWTCLGSGSDHLVPVANRPILFHGLDALHSAGIREAAIVVDAEGGGEIRRAVGEARHWDMSIQYAECDGGSGLDSALVAARDFIADGPVLVRPADVLVRDRIETQINAFESANLDALALRLVEGDGAASAGYVFSSRAVSLLMRWPASSDPMRRVSRDGGIVGVHDVDGCRPCHGGQEALLAANRRMLESLVHSVSEDSLVETRIEGPVVIDPSATLERCLVRGPAIIGPRARLRDAYVGPNTSIGADVLIEGSEIEHSIVLEDAALQFVGQRIEASVLGRGSRVTRSFQLPSAIRLALGEASEVTLS